MDFADDELTEYFEYLDALRESGETNMFGAASYLRDEFPSLDRRSSHIALKAWMDTFSLDVTAAERASEALTKAKGA